MKSSLTTLATVTTILASVVAVAAWMGFKPDKEPTPWDKAYVTHQQSNLFMVDMIKSIGVIEKELDRMKSEIEVAKKLPKIEGQPIVAPGESSPPIESSSNVIKPLKKTFKDVQRLQIEQRTLRK